MSNNSLPESLHRHAIAGRVEIITGRNGLPCAKIMTPWSTAEIYLLGAHVTAFQKNGEPPLLFLSAKSRFAPGQAIRGGVPICYPWFGPRPDEPIHGYARLADWQLLQTRATPAGAVTLWLALPPVAGRETWQSLRTEFIITVAETLTMELITTNDACGETVTLENCLHTYLQIGDINAISLTGLETVPFNDFAHGANGAPRPAENAPLRITQETNRVYPRHAAAVACDLVQHDDCFGHAKARTTIVRGHRDAEPAGLRHCGVEGARKLAVFVARKPVFVVEGAHDCAYAVADCAVVITD